MKIYAKQVNSDYQLFLDTLEDKVRSYGKDVLDDMLSPIDQYNNSFIVKDGRYIHVIEVKRDDGSVFILKYYKEDELKYIDYYKSAEKAAIAWYSKIVYPEISKNRYWYV